MTAACTGEPLSWLRLETYAMTRRDPAIAAHLATCPACTQCFDEIVRDVVAMPPLAVPVRAPRARRWLWAVPAFAAAALVVVIMRPRPQREATNIASIKGVGEVVLGVIRERDGVIRTDVVTFAPGDRFKIVVTCPPERGAWIDVAVIEAGARTADYPIAPAHLACGNQVLVPGAFELTGTKPNRVCVRVAADAAPTRDSLDDMACVTVRPE